MPSPDLFERLFKKGETQLLWERVPGDLETPVSAYLKLCGTEPYCFLLESVEGGETLGRYSIIGFAPDTIWTCKDGQAALNGKPVSQPPLESLRDTIQSCHIDNKGPDDLPPMAVSGLFGYMGYDMVRLVEKLPDSNPDDLSIPDSVLIRPSLLVIFDNIRNTISLVAPVYEHTRNSAAQPQEIYKAAQKRITDAIQRLEKRIAPELLHHESRLQTPLTVASNMTREQYHQAVQKAVEYIRAGEIFQVVAGQRFSIEFDLPSFELYRALRRLNPSPFMFHLSFEGFSIVGSSPEILVRVREGTVTIRPLAGTRKRGATPEEDKMLEEELLADPKERAEHLMLLDLGRNDVGRVCAYGSVKVTDSFMVERYSHVMHIVSNVEGRLRDDLDMIDALFAGFPAGTVSGAPKIRAMEIIDELESHRRGYYGGCAGYISGNGELDTCIALRTALVKDGKLYVQAGGGIVADSDPEFEYQETVNKSRALIRAAEIAIERSNRRT